MDSERENVSIGRDLAGSDDESDIEGLSWDGLLIEDDDDETMYCFDYSCTTYLSYL